MRSSADGIFPLSSPGLPLRRGTALGPFSSGHRCRRVRPTLWPHLTSPEALSKLHQVAGHRFRP